MTPTGQQQHLNNDCNNNQYNTNNKGIVAKCDTTSQMQSVGKDSKRQLRVEEENKRLDEAAKKKQKRQLEEINRFEQAARKKLEKQRKQECQCAIEKIGMSML